MLRNYKNAMICRPQYNKSGYFDVSFPSSLEHPANIAMKANNTNTFFIFF